jgi:putative peptide zinc metalloprotease protein
LSAPTTKTFSESWYRVASQRLSLRPSVRVRRQNFRGERWIVLENPFSNQFFRLRPAAYEFVARLRPDRTVQEVWQLCLDRFPDEAPSQEAVIQLLSQLYFANLLQYEVASDSGQLFDRYKKRTQRQLGFNLMNIMFMRFPLFDPDRFLARAMPLLGKLISPVGAALWFIIVGSGLKVVFDHFDELKLQGEGVLSPGNLPLLYAGMVLIKALHEFGHAFFCRRFGGEVHVMGVMLMIFTPMPYVDATSSWSFRSRWKRCLVAAAGMIVEIFFAAIAAFVWVRTSPGVIHSLAYNIMFIASVSTVVFNINPLLRFDGYYILSDLLEIPNLSQRAMEQLKYLGERFLFGVKQAISPAFNRREAAWYTFYGITSGIYRLIVFGGILLTVADRFLILGIVMAVVCFISWVSVPVARFARYLAASPRLDRARYRATAVTLGLIAGIAVLLGVVPLPYGFKAPGVVKAARRASLANATAGRATEFLAEPGHSVTNGQALLKLQNPELELDLAAAKARFAEADARLLKSMKAETADMAPLRQLRESARAQIQKLTEDEKNLVVRAPFDGIWVAPGIHDYTGKYLNRGSSLGLIVDPSAYEFVASVSQDDVDALFGKRIKASQVKLYGTARESLALNNWRVVPGEQRTLPSASLGWAGGGDIAISSEDKSGNTTAEPFFQVAGDLKPADGVVLLDGRSGKVRFSLAPEPLLTRWARQLWQLLQKRYQV